MAQPKSLQTLLSCSYMREQAKAKVSVIRLEFESRRVSAGLNVYTPEASHSVTMATGSIIRRVR